MNHFTRSYMPGRGFAKFPIEDTSIKMNEILKIVLTKRRIVLKNGYILCSCTYVYIYIYSSHVVKVIIIISISNLT